MKKSGLSSVLTPPLPSPEAAPRLLGDTNTNPSLWDVGPEAPFFLLPYRSTPKRADYSNLGTLEQTD